MWVFVCWEASAISHSSGEKRIVLGFVFPQKQWTQFGYFPKQRVLASDVSQVDSSSRSLVLTRMNYTFWVHTA